MFEGFTFFALLCASMFLASYFIGFLPLLGNLGQVSYLKHINILYLLFVEQGPTDQCIWSRFINWNGI